MPEIIINGKKINALKGKTILDVATENGIDIPTLCHDKELNPYGSCWVCAVKVIGKNGFVTSCATEITEGMQIETDSPEVINARKMALQLLLSDHYADCDAPCMIACPDKVDVQAYVTAIANNNYREAVRIIKDKLPMPLSIGRVCPAFCEHECRRTLVEEPIAIRQLKRYAADKDIEDFWQWVPQKEKSKGKKIAVVGAGPSGLTCGYYLSFAGYDVDIFESSPQPGGWLRYGIPEYRLPKNILDKEIELMCTGGMKIHCNKTIGMNLGLKELSEKYDAVYLAIGAQKAVNMPVKGSGLKGVYLGIDYLKSYALGNSPETGKRTAVIGGGNTAVDCARTARRLGSDVTIIYRRTKKEMPAEEYEIIAAEEEGIKIMILTNPVEYSGKDKIESVILEKMKLGEPDSSGRRSPVPTGEFFTESFDTVIAAISQIPDVSFLSDDINKINDTIIPLSKWSTAIADENTMFLNIKNIFAGGDFRRGPATAIEAIADGRIAAENIDLYLQGIPFKTPKKLFDSKKEKLLKQIDPVFYAEYDKINRVKMQELEPLQRSSHFEEVETGFTDAEAKCEAQRCLECSCIVNESCLLRTYATDYEIDISLLSGDRNIHPVDDTHPFIKRDENKCIKCGRCVRICSEIQGAGVLGFMFRGFASSVAPEFGESLNNTSCESCGKCISVCPVGALTGKHYYKKSTHLSGEKIIQHCSLCGTGCKIQIDVSGSDIREISEPLRNDDLGFNDRNLCYYGRFGWQIFESPDRQLSPKIKRNGIWEIASLQEIKEVVTQKLLTYNKRYSYISAEASLEEMMLFKTIEQNQGFKLSSSVNSIDTFAKIINTNFDNFDYANLNNAKNIIVVGNISQTVRVLCRSAQRKGSRLIILNQDKDKIFYSKSFMKFSDLYTNGDFEKLTPELINVLDKESIFIYNQDLTDVNTSKSIWKVAFEICDFTNGFGVFVTSCYPNIRGLSNFEIPCSKYSMENSLAIFYKHPVIKKDALSYAIEINNCFDNNSQADMFIPTASYLELEATFLSDDNRVYRLKNAKNSNLFYLLLNIMYETKLISPTLAEPSLWNLKIEQFLSEIERYNTDISAIKKLIFDLESHKDMADNTPEYFKRMDLLKNKPKA